MAGHGKDWANGMPRTIQCGKVLRDENKCEKWADALGGADQCAGEIRWAGHAERA